MSTKRKQHSSSFKAKVALAALKGDKTLAQLSKDFSINPNLVSKWKLQLLTGAKDLFEKGGATRTSTGPETELISQLYQQIGEQKVQLDWLKKKSGFE